MRCSHRKPAVAVRWAGAGVLMITSSLVMAGPAQTSATRDQIAKALQVITDGVQNGDSAATMARKLYAKNILIIGEGEAHAAQGIDEAAQDTQAFWDSLGPDGAKSCKFQMVEPSVQSRDTYTSFLLLNCKANPPALTKAVTVRLLYSWKKLPAGWRVVLETWGIGSIDKSSGVTDVTR